MTLMMAQTNFFKCLVLLSKVRRHPVYRDMTQKKLESLKPDQWNELIWLWNNSWVTTKTTELIASARLPWTNTDKPWIGHQYLDYWHPRADVDEQVGEDIWLSCLKTEFRVGVLGVHEGLVGYVLQHKVAAFDEAGHLILFVHSVKMQRANQIQSRQAAATQTGWVPNN